MSNRPRSLLEGAIDLHIHTSPDIVPRRISDRVAAEEAREAGMRGLLIKSHVTETASRAQIASETTGVEVYGALALNRFVGGLNLHAVNAALTLGAKVIFMPTFHAAHHIALHQSVPMVEGLSRGNPQGITLLDESGRLLPEMGGILTAIAEGGATLATGHIAPAETEVLLEAALARGVPRIILTHPVSKLVDTTLAELEAFARPANVFVEHTYLDLTGLAAPALELTTVITAIRRIGIDQTLLSSDGGQARNPLRPVEMMERFAVLLLEHGFTEAEIRRMMGDNPARALGLTA